LPNVASSDLMPSVTWPGKYSAAFGTSLPLMLLWRWLPAINSYTLHLFIRLLKCWIASL
jgi:hypothetical protein